MSFFEISGSRPRESCAAAPVSDLVAGIYAALGILAAVLGREKSGKGQAVEVACGAERPAVRAAAFPDVAGHTVHDNAVHHYVLFDRLETSDAPGADLEWEAMSWLGTDLDRLWIRSEGELSGGETESASIEAFYGRAIATWWDGLVGLRHDFGEGPSRTYAAIGVVGQAPYKFEVGATAYLGEGGQAGLGVEAEYDTLLTNRLILQWLVEAEAWTQDDHEVGLGSGLSTIEAGLRLRYEFSRRFAPYIGIARERAFGRTADLRRDEGDDIDDTRLVAGVRFWF